MAEHSKPKDIEKKSSSFDPRSKIADLLKGSEEIPDFLDQKERELITRMQKLYLVARENSPDGHVNFDNFFAKNADALETYYSIYRKFLANQLGRELEAGVANAEPLPVSQAPKQPEISQNLENYLSNLGVNETYNYILDLLNQGKINSLTSVGMLKNKLYSMLITRSSYESDKGNLPQKSKETYDYQKTTVALETAIPGMKMDYSIDKRMMGNPGWFHIVTKPEAKNKIKGPSKKRYATIDTTRPDFINNISAIAADLRTIAEQTDDAIEIKFPSDYESFIQHRDSIVIHFKKDASRELVDQALAGYLGKNNIKEAPRELDRAKHAEDYDDDRTGKTSYSDYICFYVSNWVGENIGKAPNDRIAKTAVLETIRLSQEQAS